MNINVLDRDKRAKILQKFSRDVQSMVMDSPPEWAIPYRTPPAIPPQGSDITVPSCLRLAEFLFDKGPRDPRGYDSFYVAIANRHGEERRFPTMTLSVICSSKVLHYLRVRDAENAAREIHENSVWNMRESVYLYMDRVRTNPSSLLNKISLLNLVPVYRITRRRYRSQDSATGFEWRTTHTQAAPQMGSGLNLILDSAHIIPAKNSALEKDTLLLCGGTVHWSHIGAN